MGEEFVERLITDDLPGNGRAEQTDTKIKMRMSRMICLLNIFQEFRWMEYDESRWIFDVWWLTKLI